MMKAISLKAPGRAFNLPSMAALTAALSRISTVTATACVIAAWIFAITDRDIACCIAALIGVTAALAASSSTQARKGGEL
ncbi:MAG: hypothetical protein NC216_12285 [Bacteroides sp.]|nr:hypothetical protein [Bacteroides sp.]